MFKKIIEFFVGKKETEIKASDQAPYKVEAPSVPVTEVTTPPAPVAEPAPVVAMPEVVVKENTPKPVAKKRPGRKPNNSKSSNTKKPMPKAKAAKPRQ